MAGKITRLKIQQRNKRRVNVYLDGKYAFSLAAIEAAKLHRGQVLSDSDIERLRARDSFQKAHDRALHFLSYRPRSEAEIQRYLRDKDVPKPIEKEIVQRLKAVGLLDDLAFARCWVEDRERFKPRSARMLRYELRRKGVSDEIIAQALEDLDEEESAYRAACQRTHQSLNLDYKSFRRRLGAYLRRRGFSYGVAINALERLWRELGTADTTNPADTANTANP